MPLSSLLLGIAICSVLWGIVSMIAIASALHHRGIKVNWIFLRVLIIKYLPQYREVTLKETGKAGPWYYSFIVAMNLALVTGITGYILHAR